MKTNRFRRPSAGDRLAEFVQEHRQGLWHAARLLGGYESAAIVDDLVARLRDEDDLSAGTRRRARALLALLTLENVHDPERVECGCFAVIDPEDPVTFEICALADGLGDVLKAMRQPRPMASAA